MKERFKKVSFFAPENLVKKIETEHRKTDVKKNPFSSFMRKLVMIGLINTQK